METVLNKVKKYIESEESNWDTFSALVMGLYGSGKTTLFKTARLPVLIDSFDPKGTIVLEKERREGKIVIRRWWNEDSSKPSQYLKWKKVWEQDLEDGTLSAFGTYGIDSLTTLIESITNQVAFEKNRDSNIPIERDYSIIYNRVRDIIKRSSTAGCDFIVTAHLARYRDEIEGGDVIDIDTYHRLRTRLPLLFSEKYIISRTSDRNGVMRVKLITAPVGKLRGSTQIGSGVFEPEEEPDIKKLLKKAGYSTEDKPLAAELMKAARTVNQK